MHNEGSLVPFSPAQVKGKHWLVFAPHPDDCVLGMGGSLLLARDAGIKLSIVYMTDGDKGGDGEARVAEARTVCKELSAEPIFLSMPDRGIKVTAHTISQVQDILYKCKPDSVYIPSPQEFHPDHRTTAALVWRAQKNLGFNGDIYHYEISKQAEANTLVDITSVSKQKIALAELYVSQLQQNNYLPVIEAINTARTYTLPAEVKRAEAFFLYPNPQGELLGIMRERMFMNLNDVYPEDSPLVSVLIRTKNRPELLRRALSSVKNQVYRKLEVVVVNDGGEDVSSVLSEFSESLIDIKLVDLKRSIGRAGAANIAMINSRGQFVNFLDDDDEFKHDHIQTFIGQWRRNRSIRIFYSGVIVMDSAGDEVDRYNYAYDYGRLLYANYIPIHAVTFSRKFINGGFRFDESLEYFEDWDFWIQLARLESFYFTRNITAVYHLVGDSAASPHMYGQLDAASYMNRVRDKWAGKFTSQEMQMSMQSIITMSREQDRERQEAAN